MKYQIHIDEKTYEFEIENGKTNVQIYYQNRPVEFDFQNLQGNLYSLILNGKQHLIWLEPKKNGDYQLVLNQEISNIVVEDERQRLRKAFSVSQKAASGNIEIRAPMPGLIAQVEVELDQRVKAGEGIIIIEAMKMENEIKSPVEGRVSQIKVKKGDAIEKNALLAEITNLD